MLHIVRVAAEERGFECEPAHTKGGVRLTLRGTLMRTADDRGVFRYAEALRFLKEYPPGTATVSAGVPAHAQRRPPARASAPR